MNKVLIATVTIFCLICLLVACTQPNSVKDAQYRKLICISGNFTALPDGYAPFYLSKWQQNDYPSSIVLEDHCRDDFTDIRFAYDNNTVIEHRLSTNTFNGTKIVWIELPGIVTDNLCFYIYYGDNKGEVK
jgi:hypothetical protein